MRTAQQQLKVVATGKTMMGIQRSCNSWAKNLELDEEPPQFTERADALNWVISVGENVLNQEVSLAALDKEAEEESKKAAAAPKRIPRTIKVTDANGTREIEADEPIEITEELPVSIPATEAEMAGWTRAERILHKVANSSESEWPPEEDIEWAFSQSVSSLE